MDCWLGGGFGEGIEVEIPKLIGLVLCLGGGKAAKLREGIYLLFFIFGLPDIFPLIGGLKQHIFEVAIIDPHFKLIDVFRGAGDPEDVSVDLVHEIKVDIEEAVCGWVLLLFCVDLDRI